MQTGHDVGFSRADAFFRTLARPRVGHSREKTFRSSLALDLFILDDFELQRLNGEVSADLHELIIAHHLESSFTIRTNRALGEGLAVFDDSIPAPAPLVACPVAAIR